MIPTYLAHPTHWIWILWVTLQKKYHLWICCDGSRLGHHKEVGEGIGTMGERRKLHALGPGGSKTFIANLTWGGRQVKGKVVGEESRCFVAWESAKWAVNPKTKYGRSYVSWLLLPNLNHTPAFYCCSFFFLINKLILTHCRKLHESYRKEKTLHNPTM